MFGSQRVKCLGPLAPDAEKKQAGGSALPIGFEGETPPPVPQSRVTRNLKQGKLNLSLLELLCIMPPAGDRITARAFQGVGLKSLMQSRRSLRERRARWVGLCSL